MSSKPVKRCCDNCQSDNAKCVSAEYAMISFSQATKKCRRLMKGSKNSSACSNRDQSTDVDEPSVRDHRLSDALSTATVGQRLESTFFDQPCVQLARNILGKYLVRISPDGQRLCGRVVETEAYVGVEDRASHSFGGRRTARNEAMYMPPGTSYVYNIYGIYTCINISSQGMKDFMGTVLLPLLHLLVMCIQKVTVSHSQPFRNTQCSSNFTSTYRDFTLDNCLWFEINWAKHEIEKCRATVFEP